MRGDVNPLWVGTEEEEIWERYRRSNLVINIIFCLYKISIFLLFILESFYFINDFKMIIRRNELFKIILKFYKYAFLRYFLENV